MKRIIVNLSLILATVVSALTFGVGSASATDHCQRVTTINNAATLDLCYNSFISGGNTVVSDMSVRKVSGGRFDASVWAENRCYNPIRQLAHGSIYNTVASQWTYAMNVTIPTGCVRYHFLYSNGAQAGDLTFYAYG